MKNNLFNKYPYIVAWGQKMGSDYEYVEDQCKKAEMESAPANAIYYNDAGKGKWEVAEDKVKEELDLYINGTKGGILI